MANIRRRMIWPSIFADAHFQRLPVDGKMLFIAHILAADDEGRGDFLAEDWKAFAFAQDIEVTEDRIEEELLPLLWEVKKRKEFALVEPYEVEGRTYWFLPKWRDYQTIDRPTPSKIPAPTKKRPTAAGGRPRNGAPPNPDQWEMLADMAEERGTTILAVAKDFGLVGIDSILARDVTRLRHALEAIEVRSGKSAAADRIAKRVREIGRAIQFDNLDRVAELLTGTPKSDWPKVRSGVKAYSSSFSGSSPSELFESIRRSAK